MRRLMSISLALLVVAAVSISSTSAEDAKGPSIKKIMKKCMKGGLCKKVAKGQASDAEKKELIASFTALGNAKPPKGDADSWKAKTSALLAAAKDVVAGKDGASAALGKAVNCKGCHSVHKGK